MNTVCEYHFTVSKTSKLKFTKIHLDNGVNDKNGNGRLQVCKAVSRAEFKDRDFISLNINHPNNVFCGRPQKEINRRIREDNVPNNHLIITFWSDASYSGEGFDGYFLNLRKRPNRNDLPNEKFGPRGDIGNISKLPGKTLSSFLPYCIFVLSLESIGRIYGSTKYVFIRRQKN